MIGRYFWNRPLRERLTIAFLIVGLFPLLIVALVSLEVSNRYLSDALYSRLTVIGDLKGSRIEDYIHIVSEELTTLAGSAQVKEMLADFQRSEKIFSEPDDIDDMQVALEGYYKSNNLFSSVDFTELSPYARYLQYIYIAQNKAPTGNKDIMTGKGLREFYHRIHFRHHQTFRGLQQQAGFADVLLINKASGTVLYSVKKNIDFGTSLRSGPLVNSALSQLFQKLEKQDLAVEGAVVEQADFSYYTPAGKSPVSFLGAPIVSGNGQVEGYLVVQLPLTKVAEIMADYSGLGESGESYIVNEQGRLLSNSRNAPESFNVQASYHGKSPVLISSDAVNLALAGQKGVIEQRSYLDQSVLAAYSSLLFGGNRWALIVEQQISEALAPVVHLRWAIVFIVLGVIAAVLCVVWFLTKRLISPVLQLTSTLDLYRRNWNFNLRAPENSYDELGRAGAAFNSLVADQQRALEGLDVTLKQLAGGDFSARLNAELPEGLQTMQAAINRAAAELESVVQDVNIIMDGMSRGDFSKRLSRHVTGELLSLNTSINATSEQLEKVTQEVLKLSEAQRDGRLWYRLELHGELNQGIFKNLQQALNESLEQLSDVVEEINEAFESVADQSSGLREQYRAMQRSSREQVEATQHIFSSLDAWSKQIESLNLGAENTGHVADQAKQEAESAQALMEETSSAMDSIKDVSHRIGAISGTISELAMQTTMLALNAALEAARAGEAGKGFGVVAEEVRALAHQSTNCAQQISDLVNDNLERVGRGVEAVDTTHEAFSRLHQMVENVNKQIVDIAGAVEQQAKVSREIMEQINRIERSSQDNDEVVESAQSACDNMLARIKVMRGRLKRLQTRLPG